MKNMNRLLLGVLLTFGFSVSTVIAQNDTMYVMKNGVVINKQSVKTSDVDSIVFYKQPTAPILTVGEAYQGGNIAYILQVGDPGYDANVVHGLIAAPTDQQLIRWHNGTTKITGATGKAIGTGNANTEKIVMSQGLGSYAAKLCSDLVLGGYSDWYLPSKDELNKLYVNRVAIGGFSTYFYWSSTEIDDCGAYCNIFSTASEFNNGKGVESKVRAVRSF